MAENWGLQCWFPSSNCCLLCSPEQSGYSSVDNSCSYFPHWQHCINILFLREKLRLAGNCCSICFCLHNKQQRVEGVHRKPKQMRRRRKLKLECLIALCRALLHPQLSIEPAGRRCLLSTGWRKFWVKKISCSEWYEISRNAKKKKKKKKCKSEKKIEVKGEKKIGWKKLFLKKKNPPK